VLAGTKPDGDITQEVALRMGADLGFGTPPDPAKVMDELASLSPLWRGVSYARLEGEGAFLQWPCETPDDPGTKIVHENGAFLSGKARFNAVPWQPAAELPDDEFPLFLTTGRQLFHYNVGTQTRRSALMQLTEAQKERIRIHPKDARRLSIDDGELVRVVSRRGHVDVEAELTRATKPGTVFMTFHFPETRTNLLLSSAADEYTQCPEYKVSAVRIEKVAASDAAE
jgi:predicted molibdopterin-dependent oxidoreductase YjgC